MPDSELYTRWCLANALLPAVQFSIAPWQYGPSVVAACRHGLALRKERLPLLEALSSEALSRGWPIVRPLWWHCPLDPTCQAIGDAFLLGNRTLVAPVLQPATTVRDIYVPAGRWRALGSASGFAGEVYNGPRWLHGYSVPLSDLAVFELLE